MTNEEKQKILEAALDRAYEELKTVPSVDMSLKETETLLENIGTMEWMVERFQLKDEFEACPVVERPETPAPTVARVDEPVTPAPAPAPAKATISKEEVRDKLSTYSNKYDSLDVAAIMSEMGYGKLSDIPADRYGELIERVEAHIKEGV